MSQYCYEFPRPALTVDIVLYTYKENKLKTLLIQRGDKPYKDAWAFPGGFVDENETAEQAAIRELKEETNIEGIELHQLFTNSNLKRDPRGRTVSVVYYGFVPFGETSEKAGDDAAKAEWFDFENLPELAFDHKLLAGKAQLLLKDTIQFGVFGAEILPKEFALIHLMELYYQLLGDDLLVKQIIRKLVEKDLLIMFDEQSSRCSFNKSKTDTVRNKGWLFV